MREFTFQDNLSKDTRSIFAEDVVNAYDHVAQDHDPETGHILWDDRWTYVGPSIIDNDELARHYLWLRDGVKEGVVHFHYPS